MIKNVLDITVLSTGTSGIPVELPSLGGSPFAAAGTVRVLGSAVLSGAYNISPTGTPVTNTFIELYWGASLSSGASHAVVVFGKTVPAELITSASKFKVECLYNGTAWDVNILPDDAGTGIVGTARVADSAVTTAKIADDAVTLAKMEGQTDGKIMIGDTAAGMTANLISGDATMIKGGVFTIANNAITTAKIADDAVTVEKCEADLLYDMISVRIDSKSAAAVGNVNITMPYKCNVTHVVIGVLEPTLNDTFTAVLKDNGGASMGSIDVPTSMAIGNKATLASSGSPLSSNNSFLRSENLLIEGSKTTKSSGAYNVCIYTIRT